MERIWLLKILYSIRFSRYLLHLSLLVNIDESSFFKNTWNYYGWSKIGEESITKGILFKGSVSVISSITSAGHSYTETLVGALNSKKFSEYLDRLLKYFSDAWNINTSKIGLILDNWSIHRSREINDYFVNYDINTIFIPPYCLEFAPIEILFSFVKRNLMKQHKNNCLDLSKECNHSLILEEFRKIDRSWVRNIWKPMFSKVKNSIDDLVTLL